MKEQISYPEEKQLVSQISPQYRRLDILANLFQGKSKAAALCFDGKNLMIALNEKKASELLINLAEYLKKVATTNYEVPGFISRLNEEKTKLQKYVEAQNTDHYLDGWVRRFKTNLLRVEGSIHAYKIQENPALRRVFRGNEYRAEVAFPQEIIEAISRGFQYVPVTNGMHAELKIAQELLYNNLDKLESGKKFYIATSKKCCRNCEAAIKAINDVFSEQAKTTEAPIYSTKNSLLGKDLSIATKESLVGLPGSQITYPSPVPHFMTPRNSYLEEHLRASIVTNFLDNLGKAPNMDLQQLFSEGANMVAPKTHLLHNFSLSPTNRINKSYAEEHTLPTFTQRLSQESCRIERPIVTKLDESNASSPIIERKQDDIIDEKTITSTASVINEQNIDEFTTNSTPKKKSAKKGRKPAKKSKTTGARPKAINFAEEIDWEETLPVEVTTKQIPPPIITQPIIIFYERPDDPTTANTVKVLMEELKESGVSTLAAYDDNASQSKNLKDYYKKILDSLSQANKKGSEAQKEAARDAIKIYMSNFTLMREAERQGMSIRNIVTPSEALREARISSQRQRESQNKKTMDVSETFSLRSASDVNETILSEICSNEEIMQVFKESLLNEDYQVDGKHLATQIVNISRKTEKGVVAIIEWNKAKILEDTLKELGANNITSFCVYRLNEIDKRTRTDLTTNMFQYNPDFTNNTAMPDATIINATDISDADLYSRLSECIRPVTIEPIVEYEPEQPKIGEWEDRVSRSRSPVATGPAAGI